MMPHGTNGRGPARAEVAAFGYHEITPRPLMSGFRRPGAIPFTLTPGQFDRQLDAFAGLPVTIGVGPALDPARPGRHLLLTFDDGGISALAAADALARRGWRGHFFIVTSRIGTPGFLGPGEIRELRAAGHLVGTHSHTHPDIFRDLPFARMLAEWNDSRDRLSQLLGEACVSGAVPGGHISRAVLRSADAAGLRHLFTCDPVLRPLRIGQCWVFGRYLVKGATTTGQVIELARGRGWRTALVKWRAKDAVRRALPSLFRLYVAGRTREHDASA